MHVAVIGAGVVGVTSAYYLAQAGYDVSLYEREPETGCGTTFANGGQLSYSFVEPVARPAFLAQLPRLLAQRDPTIRIRLRRNPGILAWGLRFLAQCTSSAARRNAAEVLALALRSAREMEELIRHTGIRFDLQRRGKLVLLGPGSDLDAERRRAEEKQSQGCDTRILSMDEACAIEPALAHLTPAYAGAAWSSGDEHGDARRFTQALATWLTDQRKVWLHTREPVLAIEASGAQVRGVRTAAGVQDADAVLLCAGNACRTLARPLGINLPILPARGYSVSVPPGPQAPAVSVSDPARRFVLCRISGRLRVAGFVDFTGNEPGEKHDRVAELVATARDVAPHAGDYDCEDPQPWTGARPMTPDGVPLIGPTPVRGLYLNCGHGMLGWTLAAGSAAQIADRIAAH